MKLTHTLLSAAVVTIIALEAKAQLKVLTTGNVGINQTNPSQRLDVNGNAFIEGTNKLYLYNTNRYLGIPGGPNSGDMVLTSKDAATWLRIGSAGGISLFGGTSGESGGNFQARINRYGLGVCTNGNAEAWSGVNLYVAGNGWVTGTWLVSSDKRFKNNVQPIEHALDKIMKLNGRTYAYNKDEFKEYNFNDGRNCGFVAQEVRDVLPEAVSKDSKGFYGINYFAVIPVLVEAIKEQNKKITELEAQLSVLQHKQTTK